MNEEIKKLLKDIKECDSLHKNCDYLLEHSDCDLLIEYVDYLEKQSQNNWNELKKWLESWLENDKHCYLAENPIDKCRCEVYKELLNKMQELEK